MLVLVIIVSIISNLILSCSYYNYITITGTPTNPKERHEGLRSEVEGLGF